MKLSCIPVSFFDAFLQGSMSIKDWAVLGRAEGLDAIDLSPLFVRSHTPMHLAKIKEELASAGMPVTMVVGYTDFTNPDRVQRAREMEYARNDVALASELGARYFRLLAGQDYPGLPVKDGIRWVIENFKRLADVADSYNIKLLFENHSKPRVWEYRDFSHPTEIFLEIFEKIKDTSIGINFDTANTLAYGDDPLPVLEAVLGKVETVHVADIAERGKARAAVIGSGIVPFREIFDRLESHGFDGWLCIEEASNTGISGLKEAIRFVRSNWRRE